MKTENQQKPVETVLERPDLYAVWAEMSEIPTDGVWLVTTSGKILVRVSSPKYNIVASRNVIGFRCPKPPAGPKYTGPIDDEMMANILMFGG